MQADRPTAAPPARVLVIDDELGPRESLRILLKVECDVACAVSVTEGLRLFRETPPDLVILDIRMPDRNGIDGLREIRALDALVSVIMLTGYGSLETAQEALRLGATDYLRKPFDTAEMFRVVRSAIQRTRLERQRAQAAAELEAMNRELSAQLAQREHLARLGQKSMELAHDISSPLTAILGYVELLTEHLQNSREKLGRQFADSMECLAVIDKSVARCHELLSFWRAQKSGARRDRAPVPLPSLLADLAQALKPQADEAKARIEVRTDGAACRVLADGIQVFRALQNIAVNAIQALPPSGGRVVLACAGEPGTAVVRITDTGCGIAPEALDRIFEPYYSTKIVGGGLGLGMSITRSVIEDHGGTITVDSRPGEGTTMTVRLPTCP